jgi:hypothetical protein
LAIAALAAEGARAGKSASDERDSRKVGSGRRGWLAQAASNRVAAMATRRTDVLTGRRAAAVTATSAFIS